MSILSQISFLLKFGSCPPGQRGRPLSPAGAKRAHQSGIETCQKKTRDGRTVEYRTSKGRKAWRAARQKRGEARRKAGKINRRQKAQRVGGKRVALVGMAKRLGLFDQELMQKIRSGEVKYFKQVAAMKLRKKGYEYSKDGLMVKKIDGGYEIRFPYDAYTVERIKELPRDKRRWDRDEKKWTVNASEEEIKSFVDDVAEKIKMQNPAEVYKKMYRVAGTPVNYPNIPTSWNHYKKEYAAKINFDTDRNKIDREFIGSKTNQTSSGANADLEYAESEKPENMAIGTILETKSGSHKNMMWQYYRKDEDGWKELGWRSGTGGYFGGGRSPMSEIEWENGGKERPLTDWEKFRDETMKEMETAINSLPKEKRGSERQRLSMGYNPKYTDFWMRKSDKTFWAKHGDKSPKELAELYIQQSEQTK